MNVVGAPFFLSARLIGSHGKLNWPLAVGIAALGIAQAAIAGYAAWLDGAWYLFEAKGFSQHYGAWAILLTDPLLLIASGLLEWQFMATVVTLPLCPGSKPKQRMGQLIKRYAPWVRGRGRSTYIYAICLIVGLFAWTYNVYQTIDPSSSHAHAIFKHHDVFDSGNHPVSFAVFKMSLFISWVVIYPIVGFKFIAVIVSTWIMLRKVESEGLVCAHVEHPDCCFGLKNVGTLNIAILAPFLLVFTAIFSLWLTHEMVYESIVISFGIVSIIFIVASYAVIQPVYAILSNAKFQAYEKLRKVSRDANLKTGDDLHSFAAHRLCYSAANASPYSAGTKVIITAMRAAPVIPIALKLL